MAEEAAAAFVVNPVPQTIGRERNHRMIVKEDIRAMKTNMIEGTVMVNDSLKLSRKFPINLLTKEIMCICRWHKLDPPVYMKCSIRNRIPT